MISIIQQDSHRYNVCRDGQDIGRITVSTNPYHNRNLYLDLALTQYDPAIAKELFSLLRRELIKPLQMMVDSRTDRHTFLSAGGFERRRRCYETEVSPTDLVAPLRPVLPLHTVTKGSSIYAACCELLYDYYCRTHAQVSPLTVSPVVFCADLPETVMCCIAGSKPVHYAFVEPDESGFEIAYVGTTHPDTFADFAHALIHTLFQASDTLTMECDDCDPAAMTLRSLFRTSSDDSYDTYILD